MRWQLLGNSRILRPIISNDINKSQGINEFGMLKIIKLNTKMGGTKFAGSASKYINMLVKAKLQVINTKIRTRKQKIWMDNKQKKTFKAKKTKH